MSLPIETFIAYGEAFRRRLVPGVEPKLVRRLARETEGFRLGFDEGEDVIADRVVIAVGVHPFKRVPVECADLPAELLSHSGDYGPIDGLAGKEVVVLGSGSSATDLAALLNEKDAKVSLVARAPRLAFAAEPRSDTTLARKIVARARALLAPEAGIGRGWKLQVLAEAPGLFHRLPEHARRRIVTTTLGPFGQWEMKERVIGKLPLFLGHSLVSAKAREGRVELRLAGTDGTRLPHAAPPTT